MTGIVDPSGIFGGQTSFAMNVTFTTYGAVNQDPVAAWISQIFYDPAGGFQRFVGGDPAHYMAFWCTCEGDSGAGAIPDGVFDGLGTIVGEMADLSDAVYGGPWVTAGPPFACNPLLLTYAHTMNIGPIQWLSANRTV